MADQVAQLVEHIPFKDGVLGSNPSLVTIIIPIKISQRQFPMSKSKLNLNISWQDVVKHLVRIVVAVVAVLAFRHYFPHLVPKGNIFKILVYMLIYILVSLIVDSFFKGGKKKK